MPQEFISRVRNLPPLPEAVTRLLQLTNEPETDLRKIAETITHEPALTTRLLRVANSPFYGFSQQIRTVQQATVVLGRSAVRNLALSIALVGMRDKMSWALPFNAAEFWRHCMGVACGARMLARCTKALDPEDAFVAGLLHDVGKMVMAMWEPEAYAQLYRRAVAGTQPLYLIEQEVFGYDHAQVGKALCEYWHLPAVLVCTMVGHHHHDILPDGCASTERRAIAVTRVANIIAKLADIGDSGSPVVECASQRLAEMVDLPTERLQHVLRTLPEEVARAERLFFDRVERSGEGPSIPRRAVQLRVGTPGREELLGLALQALDYDILVGSEESSPNAVLIDELVSPEVPRLYQQGGVQVIHLADGEAAPLQRSHLNVRRFRQRVREAV